MLKQLDSHTLSGSVPLVCRQWCACAGAAQIWHNRLDPQLLSASVAATQPQLPLLYHAVYARNLLRNPLFLPTANQTQTYGQRRRSSSSSASTPKPLLTTEQRKTAWVSCCVHLLAGCATASLQLF